MSKYGTYIWILLLVLAAGFLIYPVTNRLFLEATSNHPYIMGFVKFSILSMMGEFLAARIVYGKWIKIRGMAPKMIVWGILGIMIVAMFSVFTHGVDGAANDGLLFIHGSKLLRAFLISAIMNLTFAPVFMATHRVTDLYIDRCYAGETTSIPEIISTIDWGKFIKDIVIKTIPLFWIPAHTITFMLPGGYKVLFAASLSIVLGLILSSAKMKNSKIPANSQTAGV